MGSMRHSVPLLLGLVSAALLSRPTTSLTTNFTDQQNRDYWDLVNNVNSIPATYASRQYLYGAQAVVVAEGPTGKPFLTATRYGSGKVLHYGHADMMTDTDGGNQQLIMNAAYWAAKTNDQGPRVAYADDSAGQGVAEDLATRSDGWFRNVGLIPPSLLSLSLADLYVADTGVDAFGKAASTIQAFVRGGGGLLCGGQVWSWADDGKDPAAHPGNLVLKAMGIYVSGDDWVHEDFWFPDWAPSQIGNAGLAVQAVADTLRGDTGSDYYLESEEEVKTALDAVRGALAVFPYTAPMWPLLKSLEGLSSISTTGINPASPVTAKSAAGAAVFARTMRYLYAPPETIPQAPEAKWFPGLPAAGTVALGNVSAVINATTAESYWQSLGFYAMAGQPVVISLPPALLSKLATIVLHIGGWTDRLWGLDSWERLPELVRYVTPKGARTTLASAVGGLIYISLPKGLALGQQTVWVQGAIRSANYIQGQTPVSDWPTMRAYPAPWGEIGSSKLVISTQRASLMGVGDPTVVTAYWDKVMDSHAWMANIPTTRASPMRFQPDQQISGGYMHSGYPIMAGLDVVNSTLDTVTNFQHWGHFHELGHNHQQDAWTWDCVGEVTVNFFSARAQAAVRGNTNPANFYGWNGNDYTSRFQERDKYFADGPDYGTLCDSPSLYLDSFFQVIEAGGFGFDLLRRTIATYQKLNDSQLPSDDDARVQTWVLAQSKLAGYNLAPYYLSWDWPVSSATRSALKSLPTFTAPPPGPPPPKAAPPKSPPPKSPPPKSPPPSSKSPPPPPPRSPPPRSPPPPLRSPPPRRPPQAPSSPPPLVPPAKSPPPARPPPKRPPPPRPPSPKPPAPPATTLCPDYTELTAGVRGLEHDYVSNRHIMWGTAVPVLSYEYGHYYVAAAKFKLGRVVSFGHEGLMNLQSSANANLSQVVRNSARWAAQMGVAGGGGKTLCYSGDYRASKLATFVATLDSRLLRRNSTTTPSQLATHNCQLYIKTGYDAISAANISSVQSWVSGGGGLLIGGHIWGQEASNPSPATDWPANKLLLPMGILVHTDYDFVTAHAVPTSCPYSIFFADRAAKLLATAPSSLTEAQRTLAQEVVATAKAYVPRTAQTTALWKALDLLP